MQWILKLLLISNRFYYFCQNIIFRMMYLACEAYQLLPFNLMDLHLMSRSRKKVLGFQSLNYWPQVKKTNDNII